MYRIDKNGKRIAPLKKENFAGLGITERKDLQEWLANEPNAFGEEMLIIQKEFANFDGTRERLDLLALDKEGGIVVIENKLDDTGRDVVWQALKYASYCSNLSKLQIVDMFQDYLDRYCDGGDAKNLICEFLDIPDLEEVVLNSDNGQRILFVAANFRKEVTSTALWLLSHGIQAQCFKVTPFSMNEELFLNIEQIIPTPEAKEYMIGVSAKKVEEKNTAFELKNRHRIRQEFWEQALEEMRNSKCDLFNNISPSKDHWLNAGSGVSLCPFALIFGSKVAKVKLNISRSNTEENKFIFDFLFKKKNEIEQDFGKKLEWKRLNDRISSYIQYSKDFDGYNKENWPEIIAWLIENMSKMEKALKAELADANQQLRQSSRSENPTK